MNIGGYRRAYNAATPLTVLALAAGKWTAFYAASCLDGSAGAVQHWAGEVERYLAPSAMTVTVPV